MKNSNLLNRLLSYSHEKQSPQRLRRYAVMLLMLLTLGVGQMWGMTFGASTIYFDNTDANFTTPCLYIWSGDYNETWQMEKVSGSDCYWTYTRGSDFGGDGFLFKDKSTWTGQSSNITDNYNSSWWTNCYSKELGWKIVGPKSLSKTNTTTVEAGTGTSGDKFIVKAGTTITVSASGTKIDANHTVEYKFNNGSWSTTSTYTVVNSAVAATDYSVTVYVRTKRGDLTSREFNLGTFYYRGETTYNVKAVASPAAGGSVTPTSNTAMGQYTGGSITASNNTGYTFSGWTGGTGTYVDASSASTTFKPTAASTVTANFSENKSTVTLVASPSGKGTFQVGGETVTSTQAGVTTTPEVTAYPISGYRFTGWSISGGATISSTSDNPTTVTGGGAGTAATLTATFEENLVYYDVTFGVGTGYTSLGSISATNNTTSSSISSGDDLLSASSVTFTASPNTGYEVAGFYSDASCTSSLQSGNTTTYTISSLSSDVTVYVKFQPITYTLTWSPSSAPTGCTYTTKPTTGTYGSTVTMVITPSTGYTVSVSAVDASSNTVTLTKSTNTYTFTQPASAVTVSVTATEVKSTVTVTTATSSQGTLKFGDTSKSWGSTASVGVATSQSITATAAAGFTFVRWDLSGAAATASSTTSATITLKANGSGSTGTATAVFAEDLSSPWIVAGGNKIVTSGTTWRTTADADNSMVKKTGHSTESVVYFTVPVTSVCSGDNNGNFQFKIYNTSTSKWYGLEADGDSYYLLKDEDGTEKSLVEGNKNIELRAYVTGDYELKLDYSTSTPKLTVTWPIYNQVRISSASPTDATNTGNFDLSDPVSNVRSVKRSLNANTTYTFKIVYNSDFYGYNSGTFTRSTSTSSNSRTISTSGGDLTLTTDYAGDYTFKFNQSTKALSIDFPEAYKVTYGKGSVNGSTGSCSAIDLDNGNAGVTSNSTWVKSGNRVKLTAPDEKEGYSWKGWYDNTAGTGEKVYTTKVCTLTVSSAATLYACYTINNHAITHSDASHGSYTIKVGDASAVSTNTTSDYGKTITLAATPATGYHFGSWSAYKTETPATTVTVTSNQFTMPDYAVTVGATFSPNTYRVHFHRNGGAGETVYQNFTYDVAQNLTTNTYTKTGYSFAGWALTTDGAVAYADGAEVSNLTSENGVDYHLYAKWTPNPYAITFDATTNGGALEGESPKDVIFDETSIGSCPTATKDGCCFDGWYTKASDGKKVVNADGTLVANVTDGTQYTGTGGAWKKDATATVYAVYTVPTIEMSASPAVLNVKKPEKDTVVIHQTFSCTPTGTYNVVYTVGYSANHTQLAPQPTIIYGTGVGAGYDSIVMPMESANTYEIVAELRTGSTPGSGTLLKCDTLNFAVEDQYTVTLHYMVDGVKIHDSKQVYAYPSATEIASEVRVFINENGYELDYWEMGPGIDSVSGRWSIIDGGVAGNMMSKYIYARNNGNIYLHYKPKTNTVYFFNTFEMYWYSTIMKKYDYGTSTSYWADTYGAGSKTGPSTGQITPDDITMTTLSLEEKRWMAPIGVSTTNFAFVSKAEDQEHFWGAVASNEYPHVIYRTDYNAATPMFVPVTKDVHSDYYILNKNGTGEAHYYRGFWVKYSPNRDSTGYYLHVYNQVAQAGAKTIQTLPLRLTQTGEGDTWELTAKMDLEANKTYGFKITKATGASTKTWYSYNGTLTAADHEGKVLDGTTNNIGLTTTSAGDYTFHVFCKDFGTIAANNATAAQVQGQLAVTVDYAAVSGDYRVIYSDKTQTEIIASPSIHPRENGQDTVSFFIRKNATSRVMKIQKFTSSWADFGDPIDLSAEPFSIAKDSVYVIYLQQNEDGTSISATGCGFYDGDFYIRTDCVDEHKWDYKQSLDNHRMNPSDYGMSASQPDKFSHYYVHWVDEGGNVKFVVANKYAPCVSDTLITDTYANVAGGNLPTDGDAGTNIGASVRFMYNKGTNQVNRAYLAGAQGVAYDPDYLKLYTSTNLMGTTDATPVVDHDITFTDLKNFVYQAEISAKPGLTATLTAEYNGNTQYFKGTSSVEEEILGGTGDSWQKILLTYDFKVNRLICAWQPDGSEIDADIPINADIMVIREGQEDAQQIIFANDEAKLSKVKYIYSVMQFNYDDMVGHMSYWGYTAYQLCMYYISFPYDVLVNDIMAPGRMGTEWRLQRYNGAKRAEGWFAGDGVTTFWEDVQAGDTLHAYEGYSLLLNRRLFNDGSSSVWANKGTGSKLYMYFPSKDATTGVVANKTVDVVVPSHECTVDRVFDQDLGKPVGSQRNHKIVDSHWNMIGTPLFEDHVASTIASGPTIEGETLQYIYEWNPAGNVLGIRNALTTGFKFKTMYSYMAQYAGTITFVGSAVNKIVAANREAEKKNYTMNLELFNEDAFIGRTYVELRENAVDTFLLNEDVYMVKNGVNADLYTYAGAYEAGANVMTIDNHTIPVGIDVKVAGTYTFSMPDNFDGEVVLVDNYAQTRTNLNIEDYEIALPKGAITDRFYLEINIHKTPTAIDGTTGGSLKDGKAHKFIMNDLMYILKDGVTYDAQGKRVK